VSGFPISIVGPESGGGDPNDPTGGDAVPIMPQLGMPPMEPGLLATPSIPRVSIPEDAQLRPVSFTLAIGQSAKLDVSAVTFLYVLKILTAASPGDLSIALGRHGEFFDIFQGFAARFIRVNEIRVRNNAGIIRSGVFLISSTPGVTVWNADGGF